MAPSLDGRRGGVTPLRLYDRLERCVVLPDGCRRTPPAYLGDGFDDFAGASIFQTCCDPNSCLADTGNWAFDINVPEDGASLVGVTALRWNLDAIQDQSSSARSTSTAPPSKSPAISWAK